MGEILWQPDPERIRRSRMYRFLNWVNESFSRDFSIYAELHRWSVTELEQFWEFYRAGSGIHFHRGPDRVLSSHSMPGARWFEGAELNYAENLLTGDPDRTAILSKVENRPLTTLTYRELAHRARQFAAALEKLGIRAGDRVAGYLPNISETVIAMLGTAGIGAVWTSCSPDFGPQGVCDRLGQVDPALLVCTDGYFYNGKTFSVTDSVKTLATRLPGLKHVVVVPFLEEGSPAGGLDNLPVTLWPEFLNSGSRENFQFQPFPFNHPLFILYSSGTTGLPKGIVHGAGGTLLQHHKEHALHTDIGSEDVVFFYTTCGWMMWNWLVSALAQKAAIVLYEGSPSYPNLNVLWDLIDETGITMFGTSPKFLSQNIKMGIQPSRHSRFPTLRTVLSTGAPLDAQCFRWVYKNVKEDLQLSSISGGTDIISCFMLGNPMLPVQCEEIQSLGLGMDVAALDENGRSVFNQKGELACRSPAPSMPIAFWKDPDGSRYSDAYFHKFPGIWIHGDFIEIRDHGGVVVYGRSDATLNPGGIRIGSAEIYRVVEALEEVLDSLVIGVDEGQDFRLILFVITQEGLSGDLRRKINSALRREATPRHVPHEIYQVREIPKTLNGKKMELAVRDIFQGNQPANRSSMVNPGCLREYEIIRANRITVPGKEVP